MTFLPIVERELREAARRKSTWRIRMIVAAVALVISLFQLVFMTLFMGGGRTSGGASFAFMTGYAFVLCLLAGVFVTSDCISEEKREGTLGLLFLTDLRGYDVVLGKLASQLVHLGYALLAIIPAAALPLLLGGVTAGELWRISLALGNVLFFSLATGMLASALCRQAGRAMLLAAGILVLICLVLPALSTATRMLTLTQLVWLSPTNAFRLATESRFTAHAVDFWGSLCLSHVLSWSLLALASWRLPHSWQEGSRGRRSGALDYFLSQSSAGSLARPERRRSLLGTDPLLWLIGERCRMKSVLWLGAVIWSVILLACAVSQLTNLIPQFLGIGWACIFVVKVLFTAQACHFFAETRRTGSFEMLLSAPIRTDQLVSAQWKALGRLFLPPLLLALGGVLGSALLLMVIHSTNGTELALSTVMGGVMGALGILVQVLDFFALGWLGMWLSLTMRKPHLATGATILYVLILPWIAFCYAGFIGFILDIILIAVFATKLRGDFRHLIFERSTARPGAGA